MTTASTESDRDAAAPGDALRVRGLTKRFGDRTALGEVSVNAKAGERLAVIGPNGAGKTTLLSLIAGLRDADAGTIETPAGDVGWVPQQPSLYRRLTVEENLRLFARLEGVDPDGAVAAMLDQTGLGDRRGDLVRTLSGGNQQRVNIAIGLLADPAVLLLDEPSSGLDPHQRSRLWDFVTGLSDAGTTVLFTTHDIGEAARWGERLVVLANGRLLFDGDLEELREATPAHPAGDPESAFVAFLRARGY